MVLLAILASPWMHNGHLNNNVEGKNNQANESKIIDTYE